MIYIILGTVGFSLIHLLDLASLKKLPLVKPVLWFLGTGLIVYAVVMVAVAEETLPLPTWLSPAGWILFILALCFMAYVLYAALPFSRTYITSGTNGQLVTEGLYSLVRHPWLLFFTLAMLGLVLGSRSVLALGAGIIWTMFSIVLVYLQDRHVFPRMFPGYEDYQKRTPMLLPNQDSLSAFFKGLKRNKTLEVQSK